MNGECYDLKIEQDESKILPKVDFDFDEDVLQEFHEDQREQERRAESLIWERNMRARRTANSLLGAKERLDVIYLY